MSRVHESRTAVDTNLLVVLFTFAFSFTRLLQACVETQRWDMVQWMAGDPQHAKVDWINIKIWTRNAMRGNTAPRTHVAVCLSTPVTRLTTADEPPRCRNRPSANTRTGQKHSNKTTWCLHTARAIAIENEMSTSNESQSRSSLSHAHRRRPLAAKGIGVGPGARALATRCDRLRTPSCERVSA